MEKFYLIHGFYSIPNGGWRPWLMRELAKLKIFAVALEMPNPKAPNKDEWVLKIKEEILSPGSKTFLVGHSLGVPAILHYLEALPLDNKIGGAYLVAGPYQKLDILNETSRVRPIDNFFDKPFDFEHIKKVCNKFYIIHGEDDPSVPFSHAEYLSKKLDAEISVTYGRGHLNEISGVVDLPEILELILRDTK